MGHSVGDNPIQHQSPIPASETEKTKKSRFQTFTRFLGKKVTQPKGPNKTTQVFAKNAQPPSTQHMMSRPTLQPSDGVVKVFNALKDEKNTGPTRQAVISWITQGNTKFAQEFVQYAISQEKANEEKKPNHQAALRDNACWSAGYGELMKSSCRQCVRDAAKPHQQATDLENYTPVNKFLTDLTNTLDKEFIASCANIHAELLAIAALKYPKDEELQKIFVANVFLLRCVNPELVVSAKELAKAVQKSCSPDEYYQLPKDTLDALLNLANVLITPKKT